MTDATTPVASKPYLASTTIQGAALQLIVSLTAMLAVLMPKHADQINSISAMITNYLPMALGILATLAPFVMTVIGRAKATQPLH